MIPITKLDHRRRPSRWLRSNLLGCGTKLAFASIVATSIVASTSTALLAQAPPAPRTELSIWQSIDPLVLRQLAAVVPDAPNGAIGHNREGFIQVSLQVQSSWIVPRALVERNSAQVDRAVRSIAYGFAHELSSGDFEYSIVPGGPPATDEGRFSNTAFFLADVGETLTLTNESAWFQSSPDTAAARSQIAQLMPLYRRAIDVLVAHADLLKTDRGAINRTLIYSNAFGFAGRLLNDDAAVVQSRSFIDDAIARQSSDGTFPELGGFDSSYHGVSLFEAEIRFANLHRSEEREKLWDAIQLAVARERSAITDDGVIKTEGNTRISANGERLFSGRKTVDARAVTLGLLFYSILTDSPDIRAQGMSVAHRYHVVADKDAP